MWADWQNWDNETISHIINIFQKTSPEIPLNKGNLFLSGVYPLHRQNILSQHGITCVLSIMDRYTYKSFMVKERLSEHKIEHQKWIDIEDYPGANIFPHLDDAHAYLKSMLQEHNVLVHCQMGMSRSASLVIAFLMKEYGMDYHTARIYTKGKRRIIQPNQGFDQHLRNFQTYLKEHHPKDFPNIE